MIANKLVEIIEPIVPIFLSAAQKDTLPYAVYDITENRFTAKDGMILKTVGDVTMYVISSTYDEVNILTNKIIKALDDAKSPIFLPKLLSKKFFMDDTKTQWASELIYQIIEV